MSSSKLFFSSLIYKVTNRMFQNRTKTGDVVFKIGDDDEAVWAHKCVLAAISPKYEVQFYDGDFNDINIQLFEVKEPCVTVAAFNEFLQFFYSSSIVLTLKNIEGVMFLAKESLVEAFYELCIKFLMEILTVKNVCEIYYLAKLHECTKLLERCETVIEDNSKKVFITDGFIHSKRSVFLNILQLVPINIKATDVFEACIAWAKHFCTENNRDPKNCYDLRDILGDVLYSIQFKTMTIQEFMGYYRHYKNLFTDEERERKFSS
ncbi:hypothetical protein HA402_000530 [Bradysia odoriphaga]|nr:hypothetical protein HA402_000530 [Bradysia odoriphaga]